MTTTYLSLPYLQERVDETTGEVTTDRCWAHFTWTGRADRRKVKKHVRAWVKHTLGRHIHTNELRTVLCNRIRYETAT